jgi:hypothetical protein
MRFFLFFLLFLCATFSLAAQQGGIDIDSVTDIDSLFGDSSGETSGGKKTDAPTTTQPAKPTAPATTQPAKPATPTTTQPAKPATTQPAKTPAKPPSTARKKGFSLSANYSFTGGYFPGWTEAPWYWDEYGERQDNLPAIVMSSSLGLNYQISDTFGVSSTFVFSYPSFQFAVDAFYFDYIIKNIVYIRGGRYSGGAWGISRNFPYTNLLARISPTADQFGIRSVYAWNNTNGKGAYETYSYFYKDADGKPQLRYNNRFGKNDTYTVRLDIPIGIGGIQLISLIRDEFFDERNIQTELFAVGGKYNLAFKWADITVGALYHGAMPLRSFASVKTTIGNTELYAEGLATIGTNELYLGGKEEYTVRSDGTGDATSQISGTRREGTGTDANPYRYYYYTAERRRTWDSAVFSGSLGVAQDFFSKKLSINAEIFYNGESNSSYTSEKDLAKGLVEKKTDFPDGLNLGFNVSFSPGWLGLKLFTRCLYSIDENSARLVPGISIAPLPNLSISLAALMALGSRDGTYYTNNEDQKNRPFSIALAITFSGNHRYNNFN